jgi:peptidoglycan hydrolase CwlO-like protein
MVLVVQMESRISAAQDLLLAKLHDAEAQLESERSELARTCQGAQGQQEAAARRIADLSEELVQLRQEVAQSREELQRYDSLICLHCTLPKMPQYGA